MPFLLQVGKGAKLRPFAATTCKRSRLDVNVCQTPLLANVRGVGGGGCKQDRHEIELSWPVNQRYRRCRGRSGYAAASIRLGQHSGIISPDTGEKKDNEPQGKIVSNIINAK